MTTLSEKDQDKLYWEILRKQGILKEILLEWLRVLELKIHLYREREQLKVMSELMLNDIGVSRAEAETEANSRSVPPARLDTQRKAA